MYQTVNFSQFVDAFKSMGRYDQFGIVSDVSFRTGRYEALRVIFDYLEETQDDPYELDVIAICCDFAHETAEQIAQNYDLIVREDDIEQDVREYLQDQGTYVGETPFGFVYFQH